MKALVCGANGFCGQHLCARLVAEGYDVLGVDRVEAEFPMPQRWKWHVVIADLRDPAWPKAWFEGVDEVYQLAAEVGGLGYIHDKNNDATMLRNSVQINLNCLEAVVKNAPHAKLLYTSSACVYPSVSFNAYASRWLACREQDAWPYQGDNFYAHEKWFSEQLYDAYARNHRIDARVVRTHNFYGPFHTYDGGREKAPAAICRKVAQAPDGGSVEVWGDGQQTRSFMYVDDCIEGIRRLMALGPVTRADGSHPAVGPVNLGSSEMVTVDQMTDIVIGLSGKTLTKVHVPGEQGVRGRSSDNSLLRSLIDWEPSISLAEGLAKTWPWVRDEVEKHARS